MAKSTTIRFSTFPRTKPPPQFAESIVEAFARNEDQISTVTLEKGLTSDGVLEVVAPDLRELGFEVESGKKKDQKIHRPVFFGEGGTPTLRYEIDAYQPEWRCGLEVEAGRAWKGNAVYRDLVQAAVMVDIDYLCIAVSNAYKFKSGKKDTVSKDYENTVAVAEAVFGHTRLELPYGLLVLGY
jgi:hypothetical protein